MDAAERGKICSRRKGYLTGPPSVAEREPRPSHGLPEPRRVRRHRSNSSARVTELFGTPRAPSRGALSATPPRTAAARARGACAKGLPSGRSGGGCPGRPRVPPPPDDSPTHRIHESEGFRHRFPREPLGPSPSVQTGAADLGLVAPPPRLGHLGEELLEPSGDDLQLKPTDPIVDPVGGATVFGHLEETFRPFRPLPLHRKGGALPRRLYLNVELGDAAARGALCGSPATSSP